MSFIKKTIFGTFRDPCHVSNSMWHRYEQVYAPQVAEKHVRKSVSACDSHKKVNF